MAYNETLADRIRESLSETKRVKEKQMMGGLTFMVNDKMCIGIIKDEMMCRIDPELQDDALSRNGCRIMDFTGRPMKGYVMVDESGMRSKKDFDYWIGLCLDFNKRAKSSKKKK
jgi:TfoX/Sxy family transcriptional regulator of competence genes